MNKNKLLNWLTSIVLSGLLLTLFGVSSALLDQFARVPFYFTLPLFALVVNASAAVWLWQKRGTARVPEPVVNRTKTFFKRVTQFPALNRIRRANRPSHQTTNTAAHSNLPSWADVAEAAGNVHSVAWGLTSESSLGSQPDGQKGQL